MARKPSCLSALRQGRLGLVANRHPVLAHQRTQFLRCCGSLQSPACARNRRSRNPPHRLRLTAAAGGAGGGGIQEPAFFCIFLLAKSEVKVYITMFVERAVVPICARLY